MKISEVDDDAIYNILQKSPRFFQKEFTEDTDKFLFEIVHEGEVVALIYHMCFNDQDNINYIMNRMQKVPYIIKRKIKHANVGFAGGADGIIGYNVFFMIYFDNNIEYDRSDFVQYVHKVLIDELNYAIESHDKLCELRKSFNKKHKRFISMIKAPMNISHSKDEYKQIVPRTRINLALQLEPTNVLHNDLNVLFYERQFGFLKNPNIVLMN